MPRHQRRGQRIADVILNGPPLQSGDRQKRAVVPGSKDRKSGRRLKFLSCPIDQSRNGAVSRKPSSRRGTSASRAALTAAKVLLDRIVTCSTVIFSTRCIAADHWNTFHRLDREGGRGIPISRSGRRAPGAKCAGSPIVTPRARPFQLPRRLPSHGRRGRHGCRRPPSSGPCILAANIFWASGAITLSFVLIT